MAATIISIIFAAEAVRQRDAAELAREDAEDIAEVQLTQLARFDLSEMGASLRSRMMDELQLDAAGVAEVDFPGAASDLMKVHFFEPTFEEIKESLADQPLVQARMLQMLAGVMQMHGLVQEAEGPQVMALKLRIDALGKTHDDSIGSLIQTGRLLGTLGKHDEARSHLEDAIEFSRRSHGEEHTLFIESNFCMGYLLQETMNDTEAATPYYEENLRVNRRVYGDDDPNTWNALANMGANYTRRGMLEDGLSCYMESLESFRDEYDDENDNIPYIMDAIGGNLMNQGRYDEAQSYLMKCLETRRRVWGHKHPDTLKHDREAGISAAGRREP